MEGLCDKPSTWPFATRHSPLAIRRSPLNRHDVPILQEIAKHAPDCPYVGVIGSEVKGIKIKKELSDLGVEKIRLTGGEPLVRRNIEQLISTLALIPNLDLTLTTNGSLLAKKAEA